MAVTVEEFADLGNIPVPDLIDAARNRRIFVFDLETTGLNPRTDRIEGISFYIPPDDDSDLPAIRAWYPFVKDTMIVAGATCSACDKVTYTVDEIDACPSCSGDIASLAWHSLRPPMDQVEVMEELRELFEDEELICVAHNLKFDASFLLLSSGLERPIEIRNKWADSMIALYISDERLRRYGLKPNVKRIFNYEMTSYKEAVADRGFAYSFGKPLGSYAMDDVEWTWRLYMWALDSIRRQDPSGRLEDVFWEIEMPITEIITEMETSGVFIDYEWLSKVHSDLVDKKEDVHACVMDELDRRLKKEAAPIEATVGDQFGLFGGADGEPVVVRDGVRDWEAKPPNFNAPHDVSHLLFEPPELGGIGLPTKGIEQTKSGKWPTSNNVIQRFRVREPVIVGGILDWRSYDTIDSTFAKKIMRIVESSSDGRLYAKFNQTGTVIGRLSSSNPVNLMNQPRDRNLIRKSFCSMLAEDMVGPPTHEMGAEYPEGADDDILLFGCDYDQIELKVAAHLSKDEGMLEVYRAAGVCQEGMYGCETYQKEGRCRHCDLHQRSAEDIDVSRQLAKPFNFGLMYRMGPLTLCANAGLYTKRGKPRKRYARKLSKLWFEAYPGISAYHRMHERNLARNKYLSFTLSRRRRRLNRDFRRNEFKAVTQSIQFAISGTAQDIMKTAMRRIHRAIQDKRRNNSSPKGRELWSKVKLLLQVHDEIVGQTPRVLVPEVKRLVEDGMCGAASLLVPLTATCEFGQNWDLIH